ncbi:MAG: LuxR C-terminal-related transcriptional regulator, partial [Actinomycetota bacterium]|nr:LuxR C-terminal-related transcriptional regulator [Actinomycetota bacterium]
EQGRPAGRCDALASLALEAARLGADRRDEELLALAERLAKEARELTELLPGRPPWRARADAALARTALARGAPDVAADAARSALHELEEIHREDLLLDIVLPVAAAILAGGSGEEKEAARERLRTTAVLIAQRITDETIRVRWFRGPVGRELSRLAEPPTTDGAVTDLGDTDALAWLLIAGRTNKEIASKLGVSEDVVVRRLTEMYAKVGLSSPAEGALFALREQEA